MGNLPPHEVYDLKLELATVYRGLGDTTKQVNILLDLLNVESSELQKIHLKHALGIAYLDDHMRQGPDCSNVQLQAGRKYADEAWKGRKKKLLGSRDESYHETLCLLVAICEAQKDHNSAEVYQSFLPPGYQMNTEWSLISVRPQNMSAATPSTEGQVLSEARFDKEVTSLEKDPDLEYTAEFQALFEAGFDINNKLERQIALKWACAQGDLPVVRRLLRVGANVNFVDDAGETPLFSAASKGCLEIARLLLDAGATTTINQGNHESGRTAFHEGALNGHIDIVQLLLEQGVDINRRTKKGSTALIYAAAGGHVNILRFLLEQGVDIDQRNDIGWNALNLSAKKGHRDVVDLLLEKGAQINFIEMESNRGSALMQAARYGHADIVRLLLEKGAHVEIKNRRRRDAIYYARKKNQAIIVQMLEAELEANIAKAKVEAKLRKRV